MATIKVKLYDGKTQFNDVPVETINKAWGNQEYILVYKDEEFSGIAQPLGNKSLDYWKEYFQNQEDEQIAEQEKAKEDDEKVTSQLDIIESNTSYLVMLSEMESGEF